MLLTSRYYLRPVEEHDLGKLHDLIQNIDYPFWPQNIQPFKNFKNFFDSGTYWNDNFSRLLIFDSQDIILGMINWFKCVPYSDALELGYIVFKKENLRKGIMKEAVPKVIQYLFETKRVNRLQVGIALENTPSLDFAKQLGFTPEGILRQFFMLKGKETDVQIFSLLRSEWAK